MIEDNKQINNDRSDSSKYFIPLPNAVIEEYDIKEDQQLQLTMKESGLSIRFPHNDKSSRNTSIRLFLLPALIATLIFILFFLIKQQYEVPLVGGVSIATFVSILGLISGLFCFVYYFVKGKKGTVQANSKHISWRTFPTILISFGIILFLLMLVFFRMMGILFDGVSFDIWTSAFLVLVFISVINYIMIYAVFNISTKLIMTILILMIIGGVLVAMATNSEHQWWQHNFSFLGTPEANRSWEFNLTLMFSALLMLALIDFLFVTLHEHVSKSKRLLTLRILLMLTALNLGGVGLFPYNDNPVYQWLHNHSAGNLVYLIIILIIAVRWLLPGVSKDFLKISYTIGGALVVCTILFLPIGYLSLTAFELLAFTLAFSWLFLLFKDIERIIEQTSSYFELHIGSKPKEVER